MWLRGDDGQTCLSIPRPMVDDISAAIKATKCLRLQVCAVGRNSCLNIITEYTVWYIGKILMTYDFD